MTSCSGRIIMESKRPPVVIPMWITGFDKLMPEGRKFPFKFFPRPRQHISVTFGEPIPADRLHAALDAPPPAASVPEVEGTPQDVNIDPDTHREAYRPMPWLAPLPSASSAPSLPGRAAFPAHTPFVLSQASTEPGAEKAKSTDPDPALAKHTRRVRAALTAIIQEEVEALGRRVSGVWLGKR
jgi:monolysocardiolipin acyltransferase